IKTGAEGVYAGILPGPGLGIALKIDDGALRASETVMASLLEHLGQLQGAVMEQIADLMEPVLINTIGEAVGRVRPVMDWS
ncbi:MAG TPA: asparaginase, partial [Rhodospirillales bacterium]|nr:asparaginase [Rhodospirillales bacterium]